MNVGYISPSTYDMIQIMHHLPLFLTLHSVSLVKHRCPAEDSCCVVDLSSSWFILLSNNNRNNKNHMWLGARRSGVFWLLHNSKNSGHILDTHGSWQCWRDILERKYLKIYLCTINYFLFNFYHPLLFGRLHLDKAWRGLSRPNEIAFSQLYESLFWLYRR